MVASASPLTFFSCRFSTWRGFSSVASMTETTSSAYVSDSGSSRVSAASANGDSGWFSAKFSCSSTVSR